MQPFERSPMSELDVSDVFRQIGDDGLARVTKLFYQRVRDDQILAPMYPAEDFDGAEQRLRQFLIFRFGGPDTYLHERGHPRLRMRHAGFAIDQQARDRWFQLMSEAIEEAEIPKETAEIMLAFLAHVATFLMNRE